MTILTLTKKFVLIFLQLLKKILSFIPALIYGYVYSEFFTKATYHYIGQRVQNSQVKNVLDIGTATGHPLHSIVNKFGNAKILGIDIDKSYIPACQKLFKDKSNVTIQQMNFYQMQKHSKNQFDVIIFGSSFMLMPDQVKAIQIAKKLLSINGKIYFLLTLYDQKTPFNLFMQKIKPYLKYVTTVDFGSVTYKNQFNNFLKDHNLKVTYTDRCQGNIFLKFFKFYVYETIISQK